MRWLRWAPYQEFGIPDPKQETEEAPAGPITIGSVGYRGEDVIVYWERPKVLEQIVLAGGEGEAVEGHDADCPWRLAREYREGCCHEQAAAGH